MAYCTEADLEKQIPPDELTELSDDDGDGVRDVAVIATCIANADSEIDGYVGKHYAVPLATVPGLVEKLSVDLTLWNLYSRRGIEKDLIRNRYKDAVALLKAISEGSATLGVAAEPTKADSAGGSFAASDRVFSRTTLKDM